MPTRGLPISIEQQINSSSLQADLHMLKSSYIKYSQATEILLLASRFALSPSQIQQFHQIFTSLPYDLPGEQVEQAIKAGKEPIYSRHTSVDPLFDVQEWKVSWEALEKEANTHRVPAILYWRLRQPIHSHLLEYIPSVWFARLQMAVVLKTIQIAKLMRVLDEFHNAMIQHSIPYTIYKGPSCAYLLYPEPATRQFNDLDILIALSSRPIVDKILQNLGFCRIPDDEWLRKKFLDRHHWRYARNEEFVELHWLLADPPIHLPTDLLLQNTQWIVMQEHSYPVLNYPEFLLSLAIHGAQHLWSSLSWVIDVAYLLQKFRPGDAICAIQLAKQFSCVRITQIAIILAYRLLSAPVSMEWNDLFNNKLVKQFIPTLTEPQADMPNTTANKNTLPEIGQADFSNTTANKNTLPEVEQANKILQYTFGHPKVSPWIQNKLSLQMLEKKRDKILYLLYAFTPTIAEYQWVHLPHWAYFLYYPLRCCRIFVQFASYVVSKK